MKSLLLKSYFLFLVVSFCYTLKSQMVTPWLTSGDKSKLLQAQQSLSFKTGAGAATINVTIDTTTTYQTIDGFGYTLTEGSAQVISGLAQAQQDALLREVFDTIEGIGVSVIRIGIGATDLSPSSYSYNEISGDTAMSHFSLKGPDSLYLIPILKKALAINSKIKILATPWSAPRWMKNNNAWIGGNLRTQYYAAYARYFIKYFDTMKTQGISIWAITPQNEPLNAGNEPSMYMSALEETNFINNNLGPAMEQAGYDTIKIIAYDHNLDNTDYPISVANNSIYVDGTAFHLYGGNITAMTTVKEATNKDVYFTEQYTGANGSFSGDLGWHMKNVVVGSINNWSKTVIEWNLANNASMGPHTPGGCSDCLGAYTISNSTTYTRNVSYYIISHVSKFVKPGAVRLKTTSSNTSIIAAAFKNPDSSYVVLVYNANAALNNTINLVKGNKSFEYTIPKVSAATFVWPTDSTGGQTAVPGNSADMENLFPNPSSNTVSLRLQSINNIKSLEIYDETGRIIKKSPVKILNNTINIDISDLQNGVYYIKAIGDENTFVRKLIKQ